MAAPEVSGSEHPSGNGVVPVESMDEVSSHQAGVQLSNRGHVHNCYAKSMQIAPHALQDAIANGAVMAASAVSAQEEEGQPRPVNRRCKRKKREFLDFAV